ncbi:RICIN domain-containing protein [Streptomyces sp. Qhu-G9]|uniref:RICIN domain-containing protein n=1 Tax=Streptomyces sp. Qhu-G9 TaxID=3452799 RepID=UPI0022ABEF7E|nr:RICIN domain-containing protein [Streptomyces aurantiacus]WAU81651.1 RICIN domain-containing protein [Streptomyces aurantiacus]
MRSHRPLLALTAAGAALTTALAAPAQAAEVPTAGVFYVQSAVTGLNAADNGGAVVQRNPKGNEDRQQWSLRSSGASYVLESTDTAGSCLGRSGGQARTVACAGADALWEITSTGTDQYRLKVPGADQYLTVGAKASGANYPAQLVVGGAGGPAAWYLTPVTSPVAPMPSQDRRTLDQVTFLTSHNAYANGVDGGFAPPFVNLVPNQTRGIDRQLTDGVRGFMLDIHQTSDGAILCHNSCTLVSRPVALWVDIQRMVDFLKRNPDEFVTVFLEDYVDPGVLRSELARVNGLSDVLYRPDQTGVRAKGWPRMADLIAANDRLLLFTDHSRSADQAAGLTRDSFGVMYQREWTVENYWSMGSGLGSSNWACYSRWYDANANIPLTAAAPPFRPLFVMNHFRDAGIASTAATDNTKLTDRAQRFCQPAARKKPNFLAVDHYDLGSPASAVATLNTYTY